MHCQQFEQRINDLLDDRLSPSSDPAVRAHARHCGHCSQLLRAYRNMITGLKDLPTPELDHDLADIVIAELAPIEIPVKRSRKKQFIAWLRPLVALAASVLLVVGVYRVLPTGAPGAKSSPLPVIANAAKQQNSVAATKTPVQVSTGSTSKAPASISKDDDRLVAMNSPNGNGHALADQYARFAEEAERLAQQQMAVATEVADGLRPVTDSVNAAINALTPPAPRNEPKGRSGAFYDRTSQFEAIG